MQKQPVIHVVCLIGPPGSGKDTVVINGIVPMDYFPFGFSTALDYACEGNSHVEEQVLRAKKEGRLVSHHVVESAFNQYLHEVVPGGKDIVFNGFPRNADQVDVLFETFAGRSYRLTFIYLDVSEKICLERIEARLKKALENSSRVSNTDSTGSEQEVRIDDDPKIAKDRLKEYFELLPGIQERINQELRPWDVTFIVDASRSQEIVLKNVIDMVSQRELAEQ